jgi:hypothetical protein
MVHYLVSHVDKFPLNNGFQGEERGERFHQTIKRLIYRFKGLMFEMIVYYCWKKKNRSLETFKKMRKPRNYSTF